MVPLNDKPVPAVYVVFKDAIVIVSVKASVVIVTLEPPTSVKVSLLVSATTLVCPDTAMFLNMF